MTVPAFEHFHTIYDTYKTTLVNKVHIYRLLSELFAFQIPIAQIKYTLRK